MAHPEVPRAESGEVLRAIFSGATKRVDRLPALEAALERAATLCTDDLRNSAVPPPEVTVGAERRVVVTAAPSTLTRNLASTPPALKLPLVWRTTSGRS